MKQNFQTFVEKTATFKNTLLLGTLCAVMECFIMPEAVREISLGRNETNLIDNTFFITPTKMYQMIGDYGEIGRKLYLAVELTADLFYSIVLTLFLGSLLIFSFKLSKSSFLHFKQVIWLSLAVLLANWMENGSIVWMLAHYPDQYFYLSLATLCFTILKWSLTFACLSISTWNLLIYFRPQWGL